MSLTLFFSFSIGSASVLNWSCFVVVVVVFLTLSFIDCNQVTYIQQQQQSSRLVSSRLVSSRLVPETAHHACSSLRILCFI